MDKCNGHGDCDNCHIMDCQEEIVCDICGETIHDSHIAYDDMHFHTECFLDKYEVQYAD